jgi:hypothetical protein
MTTRIPLHVIDTNDATRPELVREVRDVVHRARRALDDPDPKPVVRYGAAARDVLTVGSSSIDTDVMRCREEQPGSVPIMPETILTSRSATGAIGRVVLQTPRPLRGDGRLVDRVRHLTDIALDVLDALLSDPTERTAAAALHERLVDAVGYRIAQAQRDPDPSSVDVRSPSPFDHIGGRAWDGENWTETLGPEQAGAWRLVDALDATIRQRDDGTILLHVAGVATHMPDPDMDPVSVLRLLSWLPEAPTPRRV